MDSLAPSNVPLYASDQERARVWSRCAERGLPVVAVRIGERGFVVRYDLGVVDKHLTSTALQRLRQQVLAFHDRSPGVDARSQVERVGGETGPIAGELHADTERTARRLASHVADTVLDTSNWRRD
ncbi:hypothetical protein [Halomarina oriensis]|uniref:Uncharacterized protein n=1 Tax=Halomarina oriensis TaxID=671145 RepID=A0A6B0GIK4_9EURY|nr:hypothetical protein [Halomarina oriensis]